MKKLLIDTTLLCMVMLFTMAEGCTHKDLNEDAPTTIADQVDVKFDWRNAPDKEAKTMVLYLYTQDHGMLDYRFNNPDGGIIRTYGGRHAAVCHSNDDPYGHHLRNEDTHDGFEIFTDDSAMLVGQGISTKKIPRAKGTEDEPLRDTPTMIYGTHSLDVKLETSKRLQTIEFYPEELICRYTVEFVNVENLKSADVRIDATISSLAGGYYPGRMTANSEAVSHTFTLIPDLESNSLNSQFYTFGIPEGDELPHMICLYVALKDRTGSMYTFDVSDQVNQAPDPKNVNIRIYGLQLPDIPDDPPHGEGGITIDVDTWETYHYNLKV